MTTEPQEPPKQTPPPTQKPIDNQAAIAAAVEAERVKWQSDQEAKSQAAIDAALTSALATEKAKRDAIIAERDALKAEKLKAARSEHLNELADLLNTEDETKFASIMNAIKADDGQSLLIQAREAATKPLIQERDQGFEERDAKIQQMSQELEQYKFTGPMTTALMKHCGGLTGDAADAMLEMALSQAAKFWTTNESGERIPDVKGPTLGMHPTEETPINHEGVAIWLEANIPAFKKSSSEALKGGEGDKTQRQAPKGSISERLKNAKTEEEREAIRKEAREQSRKLRR